MFSKNDLDVFSIKKPHRNGGHPVIYFKLITGVFTSLILIILIKNFFLLCRRRFLFPSSSHYRKILFISQLAFWNNNVHIVRAETFYSETLAFFQRVTDAIRI